MNAIDDAIRSTLATYGKIRADVVTLADDDDLYQAGLTSHASINVMIALEDGLEIEFPEALLRRSTFQSIGNLREAIRSLDVAAGA